MKIVVIENDFVVPYDVQQIIEHFGCGKDDVKIYTNFDHLNEANLKNIFHDINWCDMIAIETTLINKYQVDDMVALMSKIKEPKQILFTWKATVEDLFEYLKDNKSIVTIDHHNIGYFGLSDNEDKLKWCIINTEVFRENAKLVQVKLAQEAEIKRLKEEADKKYNDEAINRPTGRKIRVLRILSDNKAFKTLIPDTVVDELDMSELDPNTNRGVWVWGDGEPVKLVNDLGVNEYRLQSTDLTEIAREVLCMLGWIDPKQTDIFAMVGVISSAKTSSELHDNITDWLDENNYERRGNRNRIEMYINSQINIPR
jgi:hypothetical protein